METLHGWLLALRRTSSEASGDTLPNYFFNAIKVRNLNKCELMTIKAIGNLKACVVFVATEWKRLIFAFFKIFFDFPV